MLQISEKTLQEFTSVKPAYKKIYMTLQQAVQTGELDLTQKISEEEMAALFQCSRTPLRRALDMLRAEGILRERPSGAKKISLKEIRREIEYHAMLEAKGAFYCAMKGLAPSKIQILRELNQQISEVDKSLSYNSRHEKDLMSVRDAHLQFHMMIAKLSGNEQLYKEVSSFRLRMRQFSTKKGMPTDVAPWIMYKYVFAAAHEEVIRAIEERNPYAAEAWMYTDVIRTKDKFDDAYLNPYSSRLRK